jgi:hypothetical protein
MVGGSETTFSEQDGDMELEVVVGFLESAPIAPVLLDLKAMTA